MALRFHLDEDSEAHALVSALRLRDVDVSTTLEVGLTAATDQKQLQWATEHGRVIVTRNGADFCALHKDMLEASLHHAGIVIIGHQRLSIGERMRRLLRLSAAFEATGMRDRLEFLSHW